MDQNCTFGTIGKKRASAYAVIFVICALIVLFQGIRFSDPDYPGYFKMLLSSNLSSIDPSKGYLLEGVLVDLIGIAYAAAGFKAFTAQLSWWISGLVLLVLTTAFSVRSRSISLADLVLIVSFSRVIDTLFLWGGKFDPFLLSFLVLTANRSKRMALVGIVLASFSHPILAVISTTGIVLIEVTFEGVWFGAALWVVSLAATIDVMLFHYFFSTLMDRLHLLLPLISQILNSGFHWGLATLLSALLLPIVYIQSFKPPLRLSKNTSVIVLTLWAIVVIITSCVLTLDHTRVACLLTAAPLIVFLRSQKICVNAATTVIPRVSKLFIILFLSRLVIPHIDAEGPHLFWWTL